jgi:NAD-dependent dihydropyrimidine dehydrogenase PreA subunit
MAYVVTDACTKDFLCAAECATFAIHPSPGEPGAEEATQVYINPDECIDCGNCVSICAFGAIYAQDELPADKEHFAAQNASYFQ